MKFQVLLSRKIDEVQLLDNPFRCAVLRYKNLKKIFLSLDASTTKFRPRPSDFNRADSAELKSSEQEETCCSICFEPFNHVYGMNVTTSCRHEFHLNCLVKSLSLYTCCPLCRCPAAELVPGGIDGESIRLMAMMEVSMNAVHHCHQSFVSSLQTRIEMLASKAEPSNEPAHSVVRLEEYGRELDLLNATVEFCWINAEGFRKIARKVDKLTMSRYRVSDAVLGSLQSRPFYHGALSPDGSRDLMFLKARLQELIANANEALARLANPAK